jgi:hypothetical protein
MQADDFIGFRRALGRHVPAIALGCLLLAPISWSRTLALAPGLPVLTEVGQIHRLTPGQARQGYPVHVKAVVTYFETAPEMFIQDSTGSVWVRWSPDLPKPTPGQLIELWGITTQADFARISTKHTGR